MKKHVFGSYARNDEGFPSYGLDREIHMQRDLKSKNSESPILEDRGRESTRRNSEVLLQAESAKSLSKIDIVVNRDRFESSLALGSECHEPLSLPRSSHLKRKHEVSGKDLQCGRNRTSRHRELFGRYKKARTALE